ncbi:M1 family metallopeptidase [candidate division KSB1 bacterium]|nr:M1 family metallopeptidase [candidate division KSB1 bacterium]
MRKIFFLLMLSIFAFKTLAADDVIFFDPPLSPRIANYKIDVELDPVKKTLNASEILRWHNKSTASTNELQFHLYMNAFKNTASTFMREGRMLQQKKKVEEWGYIQIDTIRIVNGADLSNLTEFIQPDDENSHDETVLRVPLEKSIKPGEEIQLKIVFKVKLPKVSQRTGFSNNFFLVAQWFPKIGVFENGVWNCHQFHRNSEFFADFGVYDVAITLPKEFTVGATGKQVDLVDVDAKTKKVVFHAEDVHDFAWTAMPDFKVHLDQYKSTKLQFYHLPWHAHQIDRHVESVKGALTFVEDWFGEYPYSTLSFLSPPVKGGGASGMEYPTFFTCGTAAFLPAGIRFTEMVTIHECTHNYWYGMVASNEFEEPWLDEGINSYTEIKIMDQLFGREASLIDFLGIKIGERAYQKMSYIALPSLDQIVRPAWKFAPGAYGMQSYARPALVLLTLENLLGEELMKKVLHTYFQEWKFKHPKTPDFINVVNKVTGENWDWFFNQTLFTPEIVDYTISAISYETIKIHQGYGFSLSIDADSVQADSLKELDTLATKMTDSTDNKKSEEKKQYRSRVMVQRKGGAIMPIDILVEFENGMKRVETWDGQAKWRRFEYVDSTYVVSAQVDPEQKLLIDVDINNNSYLLKPSKAGLNRFWSKIVFWVQNALLLVGTLG